MMPEVAGSSPAARIQNRLDVAWERVKDRDSGAAAVWGLGSKTSASRQTENNKHKHAGR